MRLSIVLTAYILLRYVPDFGQCCGPAEIGHQYTITSTAEVPSSVRVAWQFGINPLYSTERDDIYPDAYVGTRNTLIIKNVTKNDGTGVFKHVVHNSHVYTCALPVYKRASSPTCENVTLTGNQIRTKCTTAQVFPQAKCQFTLQNTGRDRKDITDGTSYIIYTHTDLQPGVNEYYSTSCTLQYPVDGLKPENWTVQVNMYPNQTGVSVAQGTVGHAATTLQLSLPTVYIDSTSCPQGLVGEGDTNVRNGYIRQGGRANCLCRRNHVGNPPGTIGWSSIQGGNLAQNDDAVTIQINSSDTYTCKSTSVLVGSHSKSYTPEYAYGPSFASLTSQRSGPVYLCPNQQTRIDITCQIPANNFNPGVLFTIRDGNNNNVVTKVAGDTAHNKSVNYNFTKPGEHKFTCQAENVIFSDIFPEAPSIVIKVYAPPNRPPLFQVTGQSVVTDYSGTWVKQGSDIYVSCSAADAYPLVKNVTITCGQMTSSSGQLSVSNVYGDELLCLCTLDHETKTPCNGLHLDKELTVPTASGPREIKISFADDQLNLRNVHEESLNLCSLEGLELTVVCAVKQNDVRPGLTIENFTLIKPNKSAITQQPYLDASGGGDYRLITKLKVTTGSSHTLVCEARNPKFSNIKQTTNTTIEVREPPRNPPEISVLSSQNGGILVEGDDVTVTCKVSGGYPPVQSVTIICNQDQSMTGNGTSVSLTFNEIGLSYNETNCTCQATHVTGCYDLMNSHTLLVMMSNQTLSEREDSPPIGAAVGGAIGAFVVIAVVVGGIYFIRRRMKKKDRPCPEEGGYDPHQDPEAVIIDNDLYATSRQEQEVPVSAKDYTTIKPTMESATALPKKYNPENVDNPYEDVKPMELDRKSLAKKSQTKPTPGAKPKIPKTSVKTNAVPKPGEQAQNNTDSEYATVAKTKPPNSKSSNHDQTDDVTAAGASGAMPVVPNKLYDKDELEDSVNQQSASKGKQKKTKEKSAKKEKKKDKKEKMKKGKDSDDEHIYSNETFDRRGDVDVYANITMGMKSTNDVDDGMHKNKDGLVYTTIVGVGSLKGGQRPVHHSRKEAPVDYADIDFNKIVANREDQD